MTVTVFEPRSCSLGEGQLWQREHQQLFWFDINAKRLLSRTDGNGLDWQFDHHVSAADWVNHGSLRIVSEVELFLFDIKSGTSQGLCPIEVDRPSTHSNDGRAHPWGDFWIGTMGRQTAQQADALYRWFRGELRLLIGDLTIPNANCFSPGRVYAYYTDNPTRQIMRQPLGDEGWQEGLAAIFVDLTEQARNPDGAVVKAEGYLWNAQWGASRVMRYSSDGQELTHVDLSSLQISYPSFGGSELTTFYATSAAESLDSPS